MNLSEHLKSLNINHTLNFDTSGISSIKAGDYCRCMIYPRNEDELIYTVKFLKSKGYRYKLIGFCTNTLFCKGSRELTVISTKHMRTVRREECSISLSAGASIAREQRAFIASGDYISYKMSGIPGSVGGAARQNAGAYGECFSDVFLSCRVYSLQSDKIYTLLGEDMRFGYRDSILSCDELVLLEAKLALRRIQSGRLKDLYDEYLSKRKISQPTEPSLGSFFKRPVGDYASRLIDKTGLRGFRIGDACVSQKHAGFIVNLGRASSDDIISLARLVRQRVNASFNVRLEPEVDIVGDKI